MAIVYLSLGSNVGDKLAYIENATAQIQARIGTIIQKSPITETVPWGVSDEQDNYFNQILAIESTLMPLPLLLLTQSIENELGRVGKGKNTARTIDIDILYYDDWIVTLPNLIIPHPLAHIRKFILDNMLQIAPTLLHPKEKRTQQELAALYA